MDPGDERVNLRNSGNLICSNALLKHAWAKSISKTFLILVRGRKKEFDSAADNVITITGDVMNRTKETMSDALKKAIAESGKSLIGIQRETGVNRISLIRFMRGETSLRLDVADKLAVYFGLELRPKRKGR
jgi:hypothetical protein